MRRQLGPRKKPVLISNEFRTVTMEPDLVSAEINRARGFHMDPCEILIRLEERGLSSYEQRTPPMCEVEADRTSYVRNWVQRHIDEL